MDDAPVSQSSLLVAVVIGRNEGARLEPSLRSIQQAGLPLIYVDSASSDGSAAQAARLGVRVIELDPAQPLSAGRGRNEGVEEALRRWPKAAYVLFLDGDCVVDPRFPAAAAAALDKHADCAIVTGHLSERSPEASIYNRLCAVEWRSPSGRMDNMNGLGGIMMVRLSAFREVGGFNLRAIAGEEADLGVRLRRKGYFILKIDHPMATHDAHIMNFGQWWIRAVRGGHALAHRYAAHGRSEFRDGQREILSDLVWGLALPTAIILLLLPTGGLSLIGLGAYAALGLRVYWRYRATNLSQSDAMLVSRFILVSKFAHVVGIARYGWNRLRGEFRIIEYK